MSFTVDNHELPEEVSEVIVSFLHFKDLVNFGKVWYNLNERLWRKFLQRKLCSSSLWINTYKFLGCLSQPFGEDAKKLSCSIALCNEQIRLNWNKGHYLQKQLYFEKSKGNRRDIFPGILAVDCSRVVVWLKKPQSHINVFTRHNFEKEMVFDSVFDVQALCLKDDLLFAGFDQGLIRIWDLQSKDMIAELHDQVTGSVQFVNYNQGMLVTLSNSAPTRGKSVLTTRIFTDPKDITKTEECRLPLRACSGATDFDGKYLAFCGSMDYLNTRASDDDPEAYGAFVWTVDQLGFFRLFPDPNDDTCVSLKTSHGLLFAAYCKFFCVYDINSSCCLRKVRQISFDSFNSVCLNSEFIVTACKGETEAEDSVIKVWKFTDFCQESIPESQCLAFTVVSPLLDGAQVELECDSYQIVGYDGHNHSRLVFFDFSNQVCEE